MRFILMHKTDARWERGENPSPELIARVGQLLTDMAGDGALLAGEGLRASSLGVRLQFSGGQRTVVPGPFTGGNELPAGFAIVRVESLDDAIGWASRVAEVKGDVEIDVRPVTEPWDLGLVPRPPGVPTRYMLLHKADAASESGARPAKERAAMRRLHDEMNRAGVLVTSEALAPSAKGRRYKFSDGKQSVIDGPFAESKELIAGYILLEAASLDEAARWAPPYAAAAETAELDMREVEEPDAAAG